MPTSINSVQGLANNQLAVEPSATRLDSMVKLKNSFGVESITVRAGASKAEVLFAKEVLSHIGRVEGFSLNIKEALSLSENVKHSHQHQDVHPNKLGFKLPKFSLLSKNIRSVQHQDVHPNKFGFKLSKFSLLSKNIRSNNPNQNADSEVLFRGFKKAKKLSLHDAQILLVAAARHQAKNAAVSDHKIPMPDYQAPEPLYASIDEIDGWSPRDERKGSESHRTVSGPVTISDDEVPLSTDSYKSIDDTSEPIYAEIAEIEHGDQELASKGAEKVSESSYDIPNFIKQESHYDNSRLMKQESHYDVPRPMKQESHYDVPRPMKRESHYDVPRPMKQASHYDTPRSVKELILHYETPPKAKEVAGHYDVPSSIKNSILHYDVPRIRYGKPNLAEYRPIIPTISSSFDAPRLPPRNRFTNVSPPVSKWSAYLSSSSVRDTRLETKEAIKDAHTSLMLDNENASTKEIVVKPAKFQNFVTKLIGILKPKH